MTTPTDQLYKKLNYILDAVQVALAEVLVMLDGLIARTPRGEERDQLKKHLEVVSALLAILKTVEL